MCKRGGWEERLELEQTPYSVWEAEGEDTLLGFVLLTLHRKAEIKSEMVIE